MEGVKQRNREDSEVKLPEAKKLRYDIFDTLDDVEVDLGVDSEVSELTSVMKSFEEEIELAVKAEKSSLLTSAAAAAVEELDHDLSISEIGWLLEASDDELGLPPNECKEQLLPLACFEPAAEDGWGVETWEVGSGGGDGGREECLGFEDLFGYEDAASNFHGLS